MVCLSFFLSGSFYLCLIAASFPGLNYSHPNYPYLGQSYPVEGHLLKKGKMRLLVLINDVIIPLIVIEKAFLSCLSY